MKKVISRLALSTLILSACASPETQTIELTSNAFTQGQPIPEKYACKGEDISPALVWDEPPAGTQSFALIMDDPDAPGGTWVHWVLFNIPSSTRSLQEGLPFTGKNVDPNILVGQNSSGNFGYEGPCPLSGMHRYFFKLYALDIPIINGQPGATKEQLLNGMNGHILAQGELMGTFTK